MVIWRGSGLWVGLAGFAGLALANLATNWFTGDPTYYAAHVLPKLCGALAAGILSFAAMRRLERSSAGRIVLDERGAYREIVLPRCDSLFFIPAQYLPYVIFGVCVIVAFVAG